MEDNFTTLSRVRYRERQPLRAADLNDEQAYRLAMRRRHNIAHHGWGIVSGLALTTDLQVQPGFAIDGYGRELIVPEPVSIPASAFDELSNLIDVWLLYGRATETPPQRGRWDCGPGKHSRWREEARLRLTSAAAINPRQPMEVPEADLDFSSHELPPDDQAREWPVYLGKIMRSGASYSVDLANRPYVTVLGEIITAPSGNARMQVGSELAGDNRRFAVSIPDANGLFVDRLAIDQNGNMTIRGHTTLDSDLIITAPEAPPAPLQKTAPNPCDRPTEGGDAAEIVPGIEFRALAAPPAEAEPWQIYHTIVIQNNTPVHQLRFEIGHPGDKGDPARHRLVIGHTNESNNFVPCLSVMADCSVEVNGELIIEGQLIQAPIQPSLQDARFALLLQDPWLQALTSSAARIDDFYSDGGIG